MRNKFNNLQLQQQQMQQKMEFLGLAMVPPLVVFHCVPSLPTAFKELEAAAVISFNGNGNTFTLTSCQVTAATK
jgi:hypothetical protein